MRTDNSRHLVIAARSRHEYTRSKAIQALRELESAGDPVTFEAIVRKAGVSRSWLYTQPDLRTEIERLRERTGQAPTTPVPTRQRASQASLLQRLETANERNRKLAEENRRLRDQLARALGDQRAARLSTPPDGTRHGRHGSVTISPC
jgi:small-conductance mechanosensitive channel